MSVEIAALRKRIEKLENFIERQCISKLADIEHDLEAVEEDIQNVSELDDLQREKKELLAAKARYADALGPKTSRIVKEDVRNGAKRSDPSKRSHPSKRSRH